jgi:hypothetical protein
MASNNVCYAETKEWCNTFSYQWCGSASLGQQEASPALRGSARRLGFLAAKLP